MIQASQFVEPAKQMGFDFWAGVPCSYLTPFINYTIGDTGLSYISSANEGDAVAAASGAVLGGHRAVAMMQNSGLGKCHQPADFPEPCISNPRAVNHHLERRTG